MEKNAAMLTDLRRYGLVQDATQTMIPHVDRYQRDQGAREPGRAPCQRIQPLPALGGFHTGELAQGIDALLP